MKKPERLAVGFIGNLHPGKGWQIAAEGVDRARTLGHDVGLVIAGDGPDSAVARAWCEARRNYCRYLGWKTDITREVVPYIDVLALPSITEGMPMVILEIIAAGIPVIATAVGGVPEVIRDGEEGLLVERTPESLSNAFIRLRQEPQLVVAMRARCRQRWEQQFTAEIMERRYHELYLQEFNKRTR
jgi:glycosyltransferase involved in cell wall biosynthesis